MNIQDLGPKADQAESFLKAMANRHRLMILCELHKGETAVSELQRAIGLSQSSISQHLSRLREDGLVKTRRESQVIHYSLANPKVSRMIGLLYELFCADECAEEKKKGRQTAGKAACSFKVSASKGRAP
jgi:DNA-binding transcriptional ArsR family regulator